MKARVTKHASMIYNDKLDSLLCLTNSLDLYMYSLIKFFVVNWLYVITLLMISLFLYEYYQHSCRWPLEKGSVY